MLILFSGDDGPMVKKPTIDSSVLQANSMIPSVGMSDPQLIAQAAIAKYVLWVCTSGICVLDLKVYVQYVVKGIPGI